MTIKSVLRAIFKPLFSKEIKAEVFCLSSSEKLYGKKIVITGGSRGIGYAMAKKFVQEGASVLIAGRNIETLKMVSNELNCGYLRLDINEVNSFESFISEADSLLGGIDVLVNNAGISLHEKSFYDVTEDTFQTQFNTNLRGTFFLTQSFVKKLEREKRKGNILIISSETGITSDIRPYGYTKAALNSMVEGLAYSLIKKGIRINALAPGVTASEMTNFDPLGNLYCKTNMLERAYLPEEVAEVACFLLSDASACLSGQILVCNNGKTINSRIK